MTLAATPAAELYTAVWEHDQYRDYAPGEKLAKYFVALANPKSRVIDFGVGTGRGAALIAALSGQEVLGMDIARNCMDQDFPGVSFRQHDLRLPVDEWAEYGFCTDVMEHIAPQDVENVLRNILLASKHTFFAIDLQDDKMGALVGEPLHLTVRPFDWWKARLMEMGCEILFETGDEHKAVFYVRSFRAWSSFEKRTKLTVEEEQIKTNILANLDLGLQEVRPCDAQEREIVFLAGGPSLNAHTQEIADMAKTRPVVTCNGAYTWALEHGIQPGAQVIVDGRAFNKRFVAPVLPQCKYLISSQCDPELVGALPKDQAYLWHGAGEFVHQTLTEHGAHEYFPVPGGTTVALRALPLLAMLGFRNIHVYGLDSCLSEASHHAYAQPENDGAMVLEVALDGRKFYCHGWMVVQAQEFQEVMKHILIPAGVNLAIHGDGLIAHVLHTAASRAFTGVN